MNLSFEASLAIRYKSPLQRARVLSEDWVRRELYCPACGRAYIKKYNNSRIADFFCDRCRDNFELKSQSRTFGDKIVNGAYGAMIERLGATTNPNLLLLHYDPQVLSVLNLALVPKHMFVPALIEKRKPLSFTAPRAGWIGCNISLKGIPEVGRIFLVRNQVPEPKNEVLARRQRSAFLRGFENAQAKGWILSVMKCIDRLGKPIFTIEDLYGQEDALKVDYPANRHIRPKIRQQLQVLRDKRYLEFLGKGIYRLTPLDMQPKHDGRDST
jgi:type II restriction enzyme